jgi:hypothetical protein
MTSFVVACAAGQRVFDMAKLASGLDPFDVTRVPRRHMPTVGVEAGAEVDLQFAFVVVGRVALLMHHSS